MPWIIIISIILSISLIQTTLLPQISILSTQPDLFIIFLVYFSLNSDFEHAFHVNWSTGLAKDFFSEDPFGLNAVMFIMAGYIISIIKSKVFRKHLMTQILVTLTISIIYNLLYLFMLSISLSSVNLLSLIWKCPIIAVYNSIIVPPIFWLLDRLYPFSVSK